MIFIDKMITIFLYDSLSAKDSSSGELCSHSLILARMSVKPSKSRNLVFVREKILNDNALSIKVNKNMHSIPTISGSLSGRNEVESLSFVFNQEFDIY